MTINPLDLDLTAVSELLAANHISAQDVTGLALERAVRINPKLNAFLDIRGQKAMLQAKAADGNPRSSPLQGIPMAYKDCCAEEGRVMTAGSRLARMADKVTATVVARLEQAGAVEVGRLHLSELMAGPSGHNVFFGDGKNAWNPDYISGGSSSGSGTAVATGCAFASLGTDTGGSIRIPAALNGLFGLRPGFGRVSRYGVLPRSISEDAIGPLTRSARDLAYMMDCIAGEDHMDGATIGMHKPNYLAALEGAHKGSKVAVFKTSNPLHEEVSSSLDNFMRTVAAQYQVTPTRKFSEWKALYYLGDMFSKVEAARVHYANKSKAPNDFSKGVFTRTEAGLVMPAIRYIETNELRPVMLKKFVEEVFVDADIVVLPTLPMLTPKIADFDMELNNNAHTLVPQLTCLTRSLSYLGLPIVNMPVGIDSNGLPMGVQLVGKPLAEARLISFAHQLSQEVNIGLKPSELALRFA